LELTATGWHYVVPILAAVARFGLRDWNTGAPGAVSPSSGFLAGILLAFDPEAAQGLHLNIAAEVDGRRFEFDVTAAGLAPSDAPATVTVSGRAADLIAVRTASSAAKVARALRAVTFTGPADQVKQVERAFRLSPATVTS
jgi:hypothetical protein